MTNIIIGNGINVRFGGEDYSNWGILNRLESGEINIHDELRNQCTQGHPLGYWDDNLTNELILKLLKILYFNIISGKIILEKSFRSTKKFGMIKDKRLREKKIKQYMEEDFELKKLEEIYKNNKNKLSYKDIGLEDYLFLISIYAETKIEYSDLKKSLNILFNILIYNKGNANNVKYDNKYIEKLRKYDNIFTTNYDNVLEINLKKENIYHLHGSFNVLDSKYNKYHPNGFKDIQINEYDCMISKNREYYANTLYAFDGNDKYNEALGYSALNKLLETCNYETYYAALKKLDTAGTMLRSSEDMYEFLKIYPKEHLYDYHFDKLKEITGSVEIYGLSPNNDNHIIDLLNNNEKIKSIIYYYHSNRDKEQSKKIFNNDKLILKSSDDFVN